ncbi:ABC transporter ATP-binding protein [Gemmatimonadota bacterium]
MSVELNEFTVSYGDLTAVDRFTATLPSGAIGLLGPNGAGKSSLIKGLLGLVPLASGTATVLDMDVRTDPKGIRRIIGYMPEDDCLIPGLTGVGMVQYAGELSGMSPVDAMQRAHEVLFLTGLEEARYRKVETYSAGMKQRIKLAQALVHDPRLLFLDEPTSGMDPQGRQEMLDLIIAIAGRGTMSIILATHILVDVERTCDRVVIMNRGRVLRQAGIDDIQGTFGGTWLVRIEGDSDRFQGELLERGCQFEPGARQTLEVTLPQGGDTDLFLEAARTSEVQLRKLVTSVQSLEDVFMKLIVEDDHADL